MELTFRDAAARVTAWWATRIESTTGKMLWTTGALLDALTDGLVQGVKARFPGLTTDESLPLIGRERRIRRGPLESSSAYANRLVRWLDDHAHRGGPYALLEQVRAFWAPLSFDIELVYFSGRRFNMPAGAAITRDDIAWVYDEQPAKWARWWLFYHWPTPVGSDGTWNDLPATWDDGGVWDSDLTPEDVANLRAVPSDWNNAHCFGQVVLLSDERELWDYPQGTWDDPDGVWTEQGPAALDIR